MIILVWAMATIYFGRTNSRDDVDDLMLCSIDYTVFCLVKIEVSSVC